jgi:hypothetical protein
MVARNRRADLDAELENACLRAIVTEYDQLNYDLFKRLLRRPEVRLTDARSRLGTWESQPPTITLSRQLVFERPWGVLIEVLKHEMAHQFVSQVLGIDEPPHGPAFGQVCRERGIDGRASGEIEPDADRGGVRGILAKVAALLSLAESANPHEAEAAMSAAQRLMLKHNLAHVGAKESEGYRFAHLGQPTGRVEESLRVVASILREFFFVETLWVSVFRPLDGRWGSVLEVCGTEENVALAEYVHGFLTHTAERLWRDHKKQLGTRSNRDRRKYVAGVMAGFHAKLERERGHNREQGLLWIGDEKLKAFFRRRYPRVRNISYGTSQASHAYDQGRAQGERIVLHKGVSGSAGGVKLLGS